MSSTNVSYAKSLVQNEFMNRKIVTAVLITLAAMVLMMRVFESKRKPPVEPPKKDKRISWAVQFQIPIMLGTAVLFLSQRMMDKSGIDETKSGPGILLRVGLVSAILVLMYVWVSQTPSLFEYLPHFTLLGIPLIIGFFLVVFKYFLEKNAIYVALISILLAGVLVWALGRVVTDIQATVEQNMSNITLALLAVIVFLTLMGKEAIRALLLLCIILTMALVFSNKLTTVDKKTQFALWGTVILMLVIAYFIKPASATPLITPVSPPVSAETGRLSKLGADLKRWGKKFGDNFK